MSEEGLGIEDTTPGSSRTGMFQAFPVFLPEGAQVGSLTFSLLPWGAPGLSAAGGATLGAAPEPMLVLAYEWPVPWIRMATRLEKDELEAFHLQRFSTDHRLALGRVAFDAADKGDNPPDYRVVTGTRIIGVDCTALTIQERRQAHALFVNLRRRIFQVAPATLAQLAGFMVYLWFLGVESISLPFRQNDDAAIDELLAALQEYRPNPAQLVVADDRGLPDPAPSLGAISTRSGAAFYAVPNFNSAPDTAFSAVTGFELGLAYTTRHSPSAGWKEVDRLVGSHDKEGVDWLLISAGAPNRDGQTFQTEELYARFLLQNARPLSAPSHITRVTLHLWSTGEAFELFPSPARLFGPLYAGTVPSHRPIQQGPATE